MHSGMYFECAGRGSELPSGERFFNADKSKSIQKRYKDTIASVKCIKRNW